MKNSYTLEAVREYQQIVTSHLKSEPVLLQSGVLNGRYRWIMQAHLVMEYQGGKTSRTDIVLIRMVVVRVPLSENPAGIAIAQWIGQ